MLTDNPFEVREWQAAATVFKYLEVAFNMLSALPDSLS